MAPNKNAETSKKRAAPEYTSLASRRRRQPSCSMANLAALEDEVVLESKFVALFNKSSDSHHTWGKTQTLPISALRRKGKGRQKNLFNAGAGMAFLFSYIEDTEKLPNSPKSSNLLRIPLEIRENVYGFILLYEKSIIIKADLTQVESINLRCHSILRVCKQISDEASRFLYRQNLFRAVLRKPEITYYTLNESFMIAPKFISYIQNIIIEGSKDNYDLRWYKKGCECVEKLGEAKAILQSLTLVVTPQKLRHATTALGVQNNMITFADFLGSRSRFMKAVGKLACKTFRIVIKKHKVVNIPAIMLTSIDAMDGLGVDQKDITVLGQEAEVLTTFRFLISMDLTYFPLGTQEVGHLTNEETIKLRHEKRMNLLGNMRKLKRKFENVVLSHNRALKEGLCQLESEKIVVRVLQRKEARN